MSFDRLDLFGRFKEKNKALEKTVVLTNSIPNLNMSFRRADSNIVAFVIPSDGIHIVGIRR